MKTVNTVILLGFSFSLFACSTPESQFGVYQQSDGTIGVHAPKLAKETEAKEVALAECKKLGKSTATVAESRKTVNDRFPQTYLLV
uniref:Lipoprotein n=1 Tax=Polynucleobacter necessarius subsp. necessarius (strain STIR1) TaxID=452638 RepID=B1XVC9_POLNS